jgi:putative tricarboxylic transport membrane protein
MKYFIERRIAMKRGWQIATIALLVIFAFFAFESLQLSLRDALGPGPGFFPFWLSVLGGVLALILLAQLHWSRAGIEAGALKFERSGVRGVACVLAGLVAAVALLEHLGFRLAMLLLLVYLLLILGVRNWLAIALFALAGSFGVYHVFSGLLRVPLP